MFNKKSKKDNNLDAAQIEEVVNDVETGAENGSGNTEIPGNSGTVEKTEKAKSGIFRASIEEEEEKKNLFIDKEEAERFLEKQRKKKLRKRIIITTVSVLVVLIAIFVVYKVVFGGNVGVIRFSDKWIVEKDPKPVGDAIKTNAGLTEIASVNNNMGGKTTIKFSPADSLLILEITNSKGDKETVRSWPAPLESEMDKKTADDEYPKYAKNHDIVSSLVRLGYTASNLDGGKDFGINQVPGVKIEYYYIENGFKAKYTVPIEVTKTNSDGDTYKVNFEFSLGVEFYLDENGDLIVNVPKKDVVETYQESQYTKDTDEMPRVASIAVLPFINARRQGDDGYYVTPDGSGGLTYFNVPRISQFDEYQKRIYGYDDIFDVFNYPNMTNETICLPAFGAVDGGKRLTCFAVESEANASILMGQPGMKNLDFYYITYLFKWREFYQAKLSNNGQSYTFLEIPSGIGDFTIKYSYKIDSDSTYSYVDVAKDIRDFIVDKWYADKMSDNPDYDYFENAEVNTKENKNQNPDILNLKVFIADINRASVSWWPTYKVMTTFGQAKSIVAKTAENGMTRVRYSLLGWQQNGYYGNAMKKFSISNSVGGKGGLRDLNSYAKKNETTLAADVNLLLLYGSPKGASLRQATVKNPGTFYVSYKVVNTAGVFERGTDFYYMSPLYYNYNMLSKDIGGLKDLGFRNVDLQQLGNLLYTDYNKENALLRQQALEYYRKWMTKYKEKFDSVSIYYGYEYAASLADNILDIPTESSKLFIVDESVPVLEIVYHGLVDYYSNAVNRSSDYTQSILRSIEYGAFLTFEVTNETTEELRYTRYNSLFKAKYDDLYATIVKGYNIANKALAPVANCDIVDHCCVDGEREGSVYCTTYSNGTKIYVNYSDTSKETPDGQVPAFGIGICSSDGKFETLNVK